jgi:hypothetical protein
VAPDVRLVFFDPAGSFLVPHAARTFLSSLRFQKWLFDFRPSCPILRHKESLFA